MATPSHASRPYRGSRPWLFANPDAYAIADSRAIQRQAIARHAADANALGQWRRFTVLAPNERTVLVCSACGCEDCEHTDAPMEPVTLWRHVEPPLAPSAVTPAHVDEVQAWIASVLQERGWLTTTEQDVARACEAGDRARVAEAWMALQRGRRVS